MLCPLKLFLQPFDLSFLPVLHPFSGFVNFFSLSHFLGASAEPLNSAFHFSDIRPQLRSILGLNLLMKMIPPAIPPVATSSIVIILDHLVQTAVSGIGTNIPVQIILHLWLLWLLVLCRSWPESRSSR